ncbi:MAG TPA: TetR/AcrR family transcriptional regulator C-terminal domain-containing protein [Ktedonosporobacter sp.]|nr:TetR/AcrR family transcriptional regulator C-terminal domain-containing protein [Ktedonosporobacter sp.]
MKTSFEQADLRVRRTHKLLWEALMAELSERAFEEITVKDICERAMVHRTTFYKHYEDKYALLEQGMRQMYDALVAEEEHLPPSAFTIDDPPPYFLRLFEHVAQHQPFYKLMLCGEGIGRFQKLIKEYVAEVAETKTRPSAPVDQPSAVPEAMRVQFMAGAVISTLAWWLENDMPHPPRQMAHYLLVMHGTVSHHG